MKKIGFMLLFSVLLTESILAAITRINSNGCAIWEGNYLTNTPDVECKGNKLFVRGQEQMIIHNNGKIGICQCVSSDGKLFRIETSVGEYWQIK